MGSSLRPSEGRHRTSESLTSKLLEQETATGAEGLQVLRSSRIYGRFKAIASGFYKLFETQNHISSAMTVH